MFTHDEVIMLRFIGICQPSLDPERYEAVLDACAAELTEGDPEQN